MKVIVTTRYHYTGEVEYTTVLNESFFNSLKEYLENIPKEAEFFTKDFLKESIEEFCWDEPTLEDLVDPKHKNLECDIQGNIVDNIDALVEHFSYLIKEEEIFEEECCTLARRGNIFYKYCPMCGTKLQRA